MKRRALLAFVLSASGAVSIGSACAGWTQYTRPVPFERDQPGMAFDEARAEIVLFGGNNSDAPQKRNDTWLWDGTHWREAHPAHKPSERMLVAMAFDDARGNVVLFGGFDPADPNGGTLGDTWIWDGTDWIELHPSTSPPPRYGAGFAFDPITRSVLLFGGYGDAGEMGDTWSWNGTDWTELHPATAPPVRTYPSMALHPMRNEVVLFGGFSALQSLNDTWTWTGTNWTQRAPATSPPGRSFAGLAPDPTGKLVLYGGAISVQPVGDTWTWDGDNWTPRNSASSPGERAAFGFAFDNVRNVTVLFGGRSGAALSVDYREDTWTWDGTQWQLAPLPAPPPRRSEAGMAYDTARDEVVLFGGWNGLQSLGDTWIWKEGWSARQPVVSPPERSLFGMAYDEERGEAIAFGGFSNGARLNDTWSWNGANWTPRTPITPPPGRYGGAMAYDAARKKIVLFGGSALAGSQNDTWTWDGTNWTQQMPATAPPPRYRPAMGYHAATGKVVLFGGFDAAFNLLQDTWTWDGTTWTEQHPANKPSPRYSATIGDSRGPDRLLLFGGSDGGVALTSDFNDTWSWDGMNWRQEQLAPAPARSFSANMIYETPRRSVLYFGGASLEAGAMRDTWRWNFAPQVEAIVSRKLHGFMQRFDVDLPLLGPPGVECRDGGASGNHRLVFRFANPLLSLPAAGLTSGSGMIMTASLGADAREYTLELTAVGESQRLVIRLSAVTDGTSSGDLVLPVNVIAGDSNADTRTNVGDTIQTKTRAGQLPNERNFRSDVNLDGRINVGDTNFVKSHSGVGQRSAR